MLHPEQDTLSKGACCYHRKNISVQEQPPELPCQQGGQVLHQLEVLPHQWEVVVQSKTQSCGQQTPVIELGRTLLRGPMFCSPTISGGSGGTLGQR